VIRSILLPILSLPELTRRPWRLSVHQNRLGDKTGTTCGIKALDSGTAAPL